MSGFVLSLKSRVASLACLRENSFQQNVFSAAAFANAKRKHMLHQMNPQINLVDVFYVTEPSRITVQQFNEPLF